VAQVVLLLMQLLVVMVLTRYFPQLLQQVAVAVELTLEL
jgi:hypothetical protein